MRWFDGRDLLFFIGFAALCTGLWLVRPWAALIVGGVLVMLVALSYEK